MKNPRTGHEVAGCIAWEVSEFLKGIPELPSSPDRTSLPSGVWGKAFSHGLNHGFRYLIPSL
jgi:hypothetical protein